MRTALAGKNEPGLARVIRHARACTLKTRMSLSVMPQQPHHTGRALWIFALLCGWLLAGVGSALACGPDGCGTSPGSCCCKPAAEATGNPASASMAVDSCCGADERVAAEQDSSPDTVAQSPDTCGDRASANACQCGCPCGSPSTNLVHPGPKMPRLFPASTNSQLASRTLWIPAGFRATLKQPPRSILPL